MEGKKLSNQKTRDMKNDCHWLQLKSKLPENSINQSKKISEAENKQNEILFDVNRTEMKHFLTKKLEVSDPKMKMLSFFLGSLIKPSKKENEFASLDLMFWMRIY